MGKNIPICCGVDVHKKFLVATILTGDYLIPQCKKRAIIAIARMILTSIYAMISTGEVFNPSDLQHFDMPEELQKKRTIAEAKDAVKLLVSLGLVPEGSISLDALLAG